MRLINTSSYKLKEFYDNQIPPYAILSHTWEDGEVSFQDMQRPLLAWRKKGFAKIRQFCKRAHRWGHEYGWVDTCCIDKSSSAELTEAINSMFSWYRDARDCYVYLSDLKASTTTPEGLGECRWFRRGWTLQELVAPESVRFFDQDWKHRGTKFDFDSMISKITQITSRVLRNEMDLAGVPIAVRMSWMSTRSTTRVEDRAYSLLGIFQVNMPLLYGERDRSFLRLQEEIIKQTNDLSIFAWTLPSTAPAPLGVQEADPPNSFAWVSGLANPPIPSPIGILASSPTFFEGCSAIIAGYRSFAGAFNVTNNGLQISNLPLLANLSRDNNDGYRYYILRLLHYQLIDDSTFAPKELGIYVRQYGPGLYARCQPHQHAVVDEKVKPRKATAAPLNMFKGPGTLLESNFTSRHPLSRWVPSRFSINTLAMIVVQFSSSYNPLEYDETDPAVQPRDAWDFANRRFYLLRSDTHFQGILRLGTERFTDRVGSRVALVVSYVGQTDRLDIMLAKLKDGNDDRNSPPSTLTSEEQHLYEAANYKCKTGSADLLLTGNDERQARYMLSASCSYRQYHKKHSANYSAYYVKIKVSEETPQTESDSRKAAMDP